MTKRRPVPPLLLTVLAPPPPCVLCGRHARLREAAVDGETLCHTAGHDCYDQVTRHGQALPDGRRWTGASWTTDPAAPPADPDPFASLMTRIAPLRGTG